MICSGGFNHATCIKKLDEQDITLTATIVMDSPDERDDERTEFTL